MKVMLPSGRKMGTFSTKLCMIEGSDANTGFPRGAPLSWEASSCCMATWYRGFRRAAEYWDMEGLHMKLAAGLAAWFKKGNIEVGVAWYGFKGDLLGEWEDSW